MNGMTDAEAATELTTLVSPETQTTSGRLRTIRASHRPPPRLSR